MTRKDKANADSLSSLQWLDHVGELERESATGRSHYTLRDVLAHEALGGRSRHLAGAAATQAAPVTQFADWCRRSGHLFAACNPLDQGQLPLPDDVVALRAAALAEDPSAVATLESAYLGGASLVGDQLADDEQAWWHEAMECDVSRTPDERLALLRRLGEAEWLERHLGSRFPGAKRFGLEGGEVLIPLIDTLIDRAGRHEAKEICLGMAHRGRLNVLVNVLNKSPTELFAHFEDGGAADRLGQAFMGDVKYHLGFSSTINHTNGPIHVALMFNPSHLEIVSPVTNGSTRARLDRRALVENRENNLDEVVPIVVHGDAAFAGQGVVAEAAQMMLTPGYTVGGTVHIVLNNQIGFTTSDPTDARSTRYCTDIVRGFGIPVIRVSGHSPEDVIRAAEMAVTWRSTFHKDVVIEVVCYRRHGHNETDDPSVTDPLMYETIKALPGVASLYAKTLAKDDLAIDLTALETDYRDRLDSGEGSVLGMGQPTNQNVLYDWSPHLQAAKKSVEENRDVITSISQNKWKNLGQRMTDLPADFSLHRTAKLVFESRARMVAGEIDVDWGCAETLALASLLDEGRSVRLTGQDSRRGTFAHRHSTVFDSENGDEHNVLQSFPKGAGLSVYDSLLSEEAVLAFEYGYSATSPQGLVMWEAQYGDFANGAQVVIDQFITAAEAKWERMSGLVLLLPHGMEGQGPEHSSARLERYLQLCARHNMSVCMPTTAAQIFHLLRRQTLSALRRPLIVMTPKSGLRHQLARSPASRFTDGAFERVIADDTVTPQNVTRAVVCSGKVYYDLEKKRVDESVGDTAIVRVEESYPFPRGALSDALSRFPNLAEVVWVQEEAINQGSWYHMRHRVQGVCARLEAEPSVSCVAREVSSSPAVGSLSLHRLEQDQLVSTALRIGESGASVVTVAA